MTENLESKEIAIIAFGANLGDKIHTAKLAKERIAASIGEIIKESPLVATPPLKLPNDTTEQPEYMNALYLVKTSFHPQMLLSELLWIEKILGRIRSTKWAPRVIDLDLIAYGDTVINSAELTLPHPEMHKRDFILKPLAEILPEWVHPIFKKTAKKLLDEI